ncbi:MAG TPA: nitroreductase family protein [Candidatus Binataceae bacterium]|nr:nitroreductase family protein [Candidatus Binataceae bacterium]
MELKEVIGWRRSIRFYWPFRPVERAKIQKMLEAARRASCVGNVNNTRAIIIWRDKASPELLKALTPALGYQQMQTAPCFIVWYSDAAAYEGTKWINDVKRLADMRRLGSDAEETKRQIDKSLKPVFTAMWKQAAVSPLAFMDLGQAVAQATLVAYDEGLGTCLMSGPMMLDKVNKLLKLPDTATIVCIMSVGYPAESTIAGGQTVKAPFESLFYEMEYGQPMKQDPQTVEEMKQANMIQQPAPVAWRDAELKAVVRALGIEEDRQLTGFQTGGNS